jgi:predicted  nucleic acid-binding Zn-ribbon protein
VQAHDARLDLLTHQLRRLPEVATVDQLQARRAEVATGLGVQQMTATDLETDVRKADSDVAQVRTRRQRDQQRLDTGAVGSPRELEKLQHEVGSLDRRISVLEDAELEVMEQLDQARADAAGSERQLVELDAELSDATARRDESIAELDRQAALARAERARAVALVPADLLALYDKIRAQQGGVGAAALRQRRCEGCRLELNAADLRELAGEPTDAVLRCPECNRLLVRTAESGL